MTEMLSMWDTPAEEITNARTAHRQALAVAAVEPLWPYLAAARSEVEFDHRMALSLSGLERLVTQAGSDDLQAAQDALHSRWQAHLQARTATQAAAVLQRALTASEGQDEGEAGIKRLQESDDHSALLKVIEQNAKMRARLPKDDPSLALLDRQDAAAKARLRQLQDKTSAKTAGTEKRIGPDRPTSRCAMCGDHIILTKALGNSPEMWVHSLPPDDDHKVVLPEGLSGPVANLRTTAGETAQVMAYPACDICGAKEAHYDGKTVMGPWAYMCDSCFKEYGSGLGTGKGQKLVLAPSSKESAKVAGVGDWVHDLREHMGPMREMPDGTFWPILEPEPDYGLFGPHQDHTFAPGDRVKTHSQGGAWGDETNPGTVSRVEGDKVYVRGDVSNLEYAYDHDRVTPLVAASLRTQAFPSFRDMADTLDDHHEKPAHPITQRDIDEAALRAPAAPRHKWYTQIADANREEIGQKVERERQHDQPKTSSLHTAAEDPSEVAVSAFAYSLRIQPNDVWAVLDRPGANEDALARSLRIQPQDVRAIRSRFQGKTSAQHTAETNPPYYIRPKGDKFVVVNDEGEVKGTFDTKEEAREQQKALYANVPGASQEAERQHGNPPPKVKSSLRGPAVAALMGEAAKTYTCETCGKQIPKGMAVLRGNPLGDELLAYCREHKPGKASVKTAADDMNAYEQGYHDGYYDGTRGRGNFNLQNNPRSSEGDYAEGYYNGFDAATNTEDLPVIGSLDQVTDADVLEAEAILAAEGAFFHHPQAPDATPPARVDEGHGMWGRNPRRERAGIDAAEDWEQRNHTETRSEERSRHERLLSEHPDWSRPREGAAHRAVNEGGQGAARYQNTPDPARPAWITTWDDPETRVEEKTTEEGRVRHIPDNPFAERLVTVRQAALRHLSLGENLEGQQQANDFHENVQQPVTTRPRVLPTEHTEPTYSNPMDFGQDLNANPDVGLANPVLPTVEQVVGARIARLAARVLADNPTMDEQDARTLAAQTVAAYPEMVVVAGESGDKPMSRARVYGPCPDCGAPTFRPANDQDTRYDVATRQPHKCEDEDDR